MLTRTEERIIHLLASGLPSSQVASVIGVTPALLSQLKQKTEFMEALEAATIEANKGDKEETAISAKYAAAESVLLDKVLDLAAGAELRDVVGALKAVGERQDRVKQRALPAASSNNNTINATIVNLTLPAHALPEFRTNSENQIISIDSKPLAPLSAGGVSDLFKKFTATKLENKENKENNDDLRRTFASPEGSTQEAFSFV